MIAAIGVDVGGTRTRVMWDGDEFFDIPSSQWRVSLDDPRADADALSRLLLSRLDSQASTASLAVGAHGYDSTRQCRELEAALSASFSGPVLVVNDSELMAPAMDREGGIGLVVGTGSIATGRDQRGELLTAGGWGWALGDEGSAAGLVREATRAVLAHFDEGGSPDSLGRRLLDRFQARDGVELAFAVSAATSAEERGEHARDVFLAADEGSVLAASVIDDAGARLADLIGILLRRGVHADTVVAGGAVVENQPRLAAALASAIADRGLPITLQILTRAPVVGALTLARRATRPSTPIPSEQEITA
ncbi:BadF/BadG/BcrA/BcrD ATPase family protein [Microbacterium sp. ZW T5_56]|uniref:BadF/BadG/BcrA/BcrD ATPase family protein n=1 Tax=Microbacterium sp. ZW T5_56 TaxID=3378081 RepID=UPI003854E1B6